jgi:hypothetical protein
MAMSILQSRAFHLHHELDNLAGEHKLAHEMWVKQIVKGALFGGIEGVGALAALWTGMPDLAIWDRAQAAAAKTGAAGDVRALAPALDELEKEIVGPRFQFLTWKAHRDGTQTPKDPHDTPAPASGTAPPAAATPPPLPPPAAKGDAPPQGAGTEAKADAGGISGAEIAVLAALVIVTFLILQPELGAMAVAGEVADVAATAGATELATGGAAATTEAALEGAAYEFATEEVVGGAAAAL